MDGNPDPSHEFDKRLAVLEERMKTLNAENASAQERLNATMERFRTDMADLRTENANRDKEVAHRETRLILAIAGMIGLAVAILGLWLG